MRMGSGREGIEKWTGKIGTKAMKNETAEKCVRI
jgi:hypothetical protein